MIKFPCLCHYNFAVEDDQAGREIQCPRCGRLNDIPTLDQLKNLHSDGTIHIDLAPVAPDTGRVDKLLRVYSKDRVDEEGEEIDLRNTAEEIIRAGVDEGGFAAVGDAAAGQRLTKPKYDPVTGELIRPLDFGKGHEPTPAQQIPMATATLSYARGHLAGHAVRAPFLQLLTPINLVVMFFIFVAHFGLTLVIVPMFAGFFIVAPILLVLVIGLIAHYGVVVEEIGIEERDELPRLMRNFAFGDDLWRPFVRTMVAFAYCFGAAALAWRFGHWPLNALAGAMLAGAGAMIFPAVFLTTITSGNLVNLRPDRVFNVIRVTGGHYVAIVGIYILATIIYTGGIVGCLANGLNFLGAGLGIYGNGFIAYGALLVGIILMHGFCWYLGLVYRAHHDHFNWAHQYHVRTTPTEAMALSTARQAVRRHQTELRKIDNQAAQRFLWW